MLIKPVLLGVSFIGFGNSFLLISLKRVDRESVVREMTLSIERIFVSSENRCVFILFTC